MLTTVTVDRAYNSIDQQSLNLKESQMKQITFKLLFLTTDLALV